MRRLLFLLFPLLLALPHISLSGEEIGAVKPAVYAVQMHADWCGACKALDPKVAEARLEGELDDQDVLFVKLDLTNETTKAQAAKMAAALGIAEIYDSNAGKTGFMLLVDAKTGEKITRITNKSDSDEIANRVMESIKTVKA